VRSYPNPMNRHDATMEDMKIPGSHLLEATLGEWSWAEIVHITGLTYSVDDSTTGRTTLSIETSWRDTLSGFCRCEATVVFRGVTQLSLKAVGGPIQTGGFYVDDIRDRGWSDIRYEVGDFETGVLSLYCELVEIAHVRPHPR